VLSERLAHLEDIEKAIGRLWPAGVEKLPTIDYYVGGRSEKEREIAAKARVILATSQFASEGLDIPALDTLVLGTPMSDVEQAVGRILRPFEGKKPPIVVDIRDDRVPLFRGLGDKRDRLYSRIT
jgi:superfamily II DNA or RNA helicase